MNDIQPFEHAPLEDSASQIRLLRLSETSPHGTLAFDIDHYRFSDRLTDEIESFPPCPSYIALSYTWGSPEKTHEVLINGKWLKVGANCHYALSQAVELKSFPSREQHYWIDQISINQEDVHEKEKQVGNMGHIFRQVSMVFACIGPHADDSKLLFDTINGLDMEAFHALPDERSSSRGPYSERRELVKRYLDQEDEPGKRFQDLQNALEPFTLRQYWHRVWVVQELVLSAATTILCGEDSAAIGRLVGLWNTVRYKAFEREKRGLYRRWLWTTYDQPEVIRDWLLIKPHSGPAPIAFLDAVLLFPDLECADSRDYVYGVRAMVAWPQDVDLPQPDYTISAHDLFLNMIPVLLAKEWRTSHRVLFGDYLDMVRAIFGVNEESARSICESLGSFRMLWRALHDSDMEGTVVRELLLRITGDVYCTVKIPCADLIEHYCTATTGKQFWMRCGFRMKRGCFNICQRLLAGASAHISTLGHWRKDSKDDKA